MMIEHVDFSTKQWDQKSWKNGTVPILIRLLQSDLSIHWLLRQFCPLCYGQDGIILENVLK